MAEDAQVENPYLPVYLPEFDLSVGWAMCRNSMCPNFGIQYDGPAPDGPGEIKDGRYTIDPIEGNFHCEYCGLSFTLNSNRAIRVLARYFLSLSIPFDTCPNKECENYGRNVFEHHPPGRHRGRPYWVRDAGKHRISCRRCRKPDGKEQTFTVGSPLGITRNRTTKQRLRGIIRGAMYYRSLSMIIEDVRVSEDTYYTQLKDAGERLREYVAWRNAFLFQERFAEHDAPLCVYTDTLIVSLRRLGEKPRYTQLRIPVSAIELPEHRTYYILAAHPGFLPIEYCQKNTLELIREVNCLPHESPWDCAEHPLRVDSSKSVGEQMGSSPDIGRGGWFAVSPYTDLAHFLTIRKMLWRFPKVHHYMDAELTQSAAALTAFADEVRAGRWEIALYQSNRERKKKKGTQAKRTNIVRARWPKLGGEREKWLKDSVDAQWETREARWKKKLEDDDLFSAAAGEADPQFVAKQFAEARDGANSPGGWAWLEHPPAGMRYEGGRCLWLTQRPNASYEEVGRELLWPSAILPVDRAHSHLRDDIRSFERASFRAKPGRSYRNANLDPFVLFAELWIAMLWRNFGPRHHPAFRDEALKEKDKTEREKKREKSTPRPPPAWSMCLRRPKESGRPDLTDLAWEFRVGIEEVCRMNQWLRKR